MIDIHLVCVMADEASQVAAAAAVPAAAEAAVATDDQFVADGAKIPLSPAAGAIQFGV